jgi:hypothetical protein
VLFVIASTSKIIKSEKKANIARIIFFASASLNIPVINVISTMLFPQFKSSFEFIVSAEPCPEFISGQGSASNSFVVRLS